MVLRQEPLDFIREWNAAESAVRFFPSAQGEEVYAVSVRFDGLSIGQSGVGFETWDMFRGTISRRSHHTVLVMSDVGAFRSGILDLAVSTRKVNYNPYRLTGVLKWLTEEILVQRDEAG